MWCAETQNTVTGRMNIKMNSKTSLNSHRKGGAKEKNKEIANRREEESAWFLKQ